MNIDPTDKLNGYENLKLVVNDTYVYTQDQEPPISLDLTIEEFKERFNEAARNAGLSIGITSIVPDQNTFEIRAYDGLWIYGYLNEKDGKIREIQVKGHPDGKDAEKLSLEQRINDFYTLAFLCISAVDPNLTKEQKEQILWDLGYTYEINHDEKFDVIIGDVKYSNRDINVAYSRFSGPLFTIRDPKDER